MAETGPLLTACPAERWIPPALVARARWRAPLRARRGGDRVSRRGRWRRPPPPWRPTSRGCWRGSRWRSPSWCGRSRRGAGGPGAEVDGGRRARAGVGRRGGIARARPRGRAPGRRRPAGSGVRLLAARASLTAGGVGALSAALDELGAGARAHDADLGGARTPASRRGEPRPRGGRRSGARVRRGVACPPGRQARRRRRAAAARAVRARRRVSRGGRIPRHAAGAEAEAGPGSVRTRCARRTPAASTYPEP